jgi:hypothetical protein
MQLVIDNAGKQDRRDARRPDELREVLGYLPQDSGVYPDCPRCGWPSSPAVVSRSIWRWWESGHT